MPGERHKEHSCVCTNVDEISFFTRSQDAKVLLGTVLLLFQLITKKEFPFFSGIKHCTKETSAIGQDCTSELCLMICPLPVCSGSAMEQTRLTLARLRVYLAVLTGL